MRKLKSFGRDRRGVTAVEFALIAPLMIVLYFGLVELCQAMIGERKASHVASAEGDLVAQAETVTPADMADIFSIGRTIMSPFDTSTLKMRVTSVTADSKAVPKVDWSQGSGGYTPLHQTATVTLPMTLNAGDSLVMSEVSYQYTSPIGYVLSKVMTFNEVFYLRPRKSSQVTCPTCPAT